MFEIASSESISVFGTKPMKDINNSKEGIVISDSLS